MAVPLALFFGFTVVFGSAYTYCGTAAVLFANAAQIFLASWAFLSYSLWGLLVLVLLMEWFDERHVKDAITRPPRNKVEALIDRRAFAFPLVVLALCWLPWLIGCYPGIFMGDTGDLIAQWHHLPSWTSKYLDLLDTDVYLNSHQPVLHTILVNICVDFGHAVFGSYNVGYFLYTLVQFALVIAAISCAFLYLSKLGVPSAYRVAALAFVALCPVFPTFALLGTKDGLFGCGTLLIVVIGLNFLSAPRTIDLRTLIVFIAGAVAFVLLRNGTIAFFVIFALVLWAMTRRKVPRGRMSFALVAPVVVFALFTYGLLPAMDVTPGSKREMLSIPIQQVARCAVVNGDQFTEDDKEASNGVLDYDYVVRKYRPNQSDPAKHTFNDSADSSKVHAFFSTWLELLQRYPLTCLDATGANYYQYFYPDDSDFVYGYTESVKWTRHKDAHPDVFDFYMAEMPAVKVLGYATYKYYWAWRVVLPFSAFVSSAFYSWLLIVLFANALRTRSSSWVVLLPLVLLLLLALAGPMNGNYIRYMFGIMLTMPFYVAWVASHLRTSSEGDEGIVRLAGIAAFGDS